MKDIQLIENMSEIGAGTRGASLGMQALKVASINKGSSYFRSFKIIRVEDRNELLWQKTEASNAKRIDGIETVYHRIAKKVTETLKQDKFPLIIAADHASAGGTIAGIKQAFPNKRLGVIWVDAHADLHSPYTSPSGNVHGMPLATAINEDNLESKCVDLPKNTIESWESMKNLGGIRPKILPSDLIFFGVRDMEAPEEHLMKKHGIKNFTVVECRSLGIEKAAESAIELLDDCDLIYISFDVDSMDPDEVSYGTGTPVKNGFHPAEVESLMRNLITKSGKVCCFEMVEVNPLLDQQGNKMAETAFGILERLTHDLKEEGI